MQGQDILGIIVMVHSRRMDMELLNLWLRQLHILAHNINLSLLGVTEVGHTIVAYATNENNDVTYKALGKAIYKEGSPDEYTGDGLEVEPQEGTNNFIITAKAGGVYILKLFTEDSYNQEGKYDIVMRDAGIQNIDLRADKRELRFSGTYRHNIDVFTDAAFGFIYRVNPNHTDEFGNESIFMLKLTHALGI